MIYFIALCSGFTIILSMVQNGRLSGYIGLKNTTFMNFLTGFLGSLLLLLISRGTLSDFSHLQGVPLLGFFGGLFGVIAVTISSLVVQHVSVIASTMLSYIGQLLMGILIDALLGISLSPGKWIGCLFILAGVIISQQPQKQVKEDASQTDGLTAS